VIVAVAAGAGGAILTYAACSGLNVSSGTRMLITLIGTLVVATPYLAVVAFMDLASEDPAGAGLARARRVGVGSAEVQISIAGEISRHFVRL
jgi:hypothetical protein